MIGAFLRLLEEHPTAPNIFNPWRDHDPDNDVSTESPRHRLTHLGAYLKRRERSARLILLAEAPGYCGCKFSGLAMSSERDLLAGQGLLSSPYFDGPVYRTSKIARRLKNDAGMLERTATIVWRAMLEGGWQHDEFVLWNIHAFHPHAPGNPLSNRRPSRVEVEKALPVFNAFRAVFPQLPIVSVGQVSQETLAALKIPYIPARHPSYGGATIFRETIAGLRTSL